MKSNDSVKNMIRWYIRENENHQYLWQTDEYKQETYSIWAARELLNELRKNKNKPPLVVMEDFRDRMDRYSCMNPATSFIFSVAKDTVEMFIDMIIK